MGTTNITDAITNEIIQEGDAVIAILLETADPKFLGHQSNATHRIASFPMEGIWDGLKVVPHDDMTFSSNFNQIVMQRSHGNHKSIPDSFEDIQSQLRINPEINGKTYSLMVLRDTTPGLLLSMDGMDFKTGSSSAEQDIEKSHALAQEYLRVYDLFNEGDRSDGIRAHLGRMREALSFRSTQTHINGLELPNVASAIYRDSMCPFSFRLIDVLEEEVYGFDGVSAHLEEYRELPEDYNEIVAKLHQAQFIAKALDVMGRQLAPSISTIARLDDTATLEFASKTIASDIARKLDYAKQERDPSMLNVVDQQIEDLKRMLFESVQLRKEIGRSLGISKGPEPR